MLFVAIADQVTKFLFFDILSFDPPVVVIPNFFRIVLRTNPAAAFSLGPSNPYFYMAATILGFGILIWFLSGISSERLFPILGLGMIGGGAVGNLIDRVLFHEVRDFIDIHWFYQYHWPAFNVADAAICAGVAIVIWESLRSQIKGEA